MTVAGAVRYRFGVEDEPHLGRATKRERGGSLGEKIHTLFITQGVAELVSPFRVACFQRARHTGGRCRSLFPRPLGARQSVLHL